MADEVRVCDLLVAIEAGNPRLCGQPAAGPDPIWPDKWLCRKHLEDMDWQEVDDWLGREEE